MREAVNWNKMDNEIYKQFWELNVRQFWVDEEIPVSDDKKDWLSDTLSDVEKDTYEKVLAGLTLLDTEQGGVGMPHFVIGHPNLHAKAVFSFMGMMEQMHAKSYSTIFSTLSSTERIDELFQWVLDNEFLQKKIEIVERNYINITDSESLYKALASSVLLETFLFFSGFYYPLYFAAQGKLVKSGEIISLIVRDESNHGAFCGLMAQEEYDKMDVQKQEEMRTYVHNLLIELYEVEMEYTKDLYTPVGLEDDVVKYIEYNADQALLNLGFQPYFNRESHEINPVILNGINTETKNHDFFSTKGNGYIKTLNVEPLDDDIFDI